MNGLFDNTMCDDEVTLTKFIAPQPNRQPATMKSILSLRAVVIVTVCIFLAQFAPAQTYDGPWAETRDWFAPGDTQPDGAFCLVNSADSIDGEVVKPTKAQITAGVAAGSVKWRCKLATVKTGDTVTMVTRLTRYGTTTTGRRHAYTIGVPYNVRTYGTSSQQLGTVVLNLTPIVDAPPVATPPAPPASTPQAWVQVATEGQPLGVPAGTQVRLCYWDTCVTKAATAGAVCGIDFFGSDPAPGHGKTCEAFK